MSLAAFEPAATIKPYGVAPVAVATACPLVLNNCPTREFDAFTVPLSVGTLWNEETALLGVDVDPEKRAGPRESESDSDVDEMQAGSTSGTSRGDGDLRVIIKLPLSSAETAASDVLQRLRLRVVGGWKPVGDGGRGMIGGGGGGGAGGGVERRGEERSTSGGGRCRRSERVVGKGMGVAGDGRSTILA